MVYEQNSLGPLWRINQRRDVHFQQNATAV